MNLPTFGGSGVGAAPPPKNIERGIYEYVTNSAHDTGVVSECKKGNCTKELYVQFSFSNYVDREKVLYFLR